MAARRVAIVPHTHWDREWYRSFQEFRLNLVDTLDALLCLLESDDSYPYFMLDGQMAVVDDYLDVRPEGEERLRALAVAGRISLGPWYILMDEFLASGETIVRNLQMGLRRAAAFGGAMEVGYLPDMFGHIAQMPQILRQAGLTNAVVWRGVPSVVNRTGFVWEAPDGSAVRAEYLPDGYSNGAALPDDGQALVDRVTDLLEEHREFVLGDLRRQLEAAGSSMEKVLRCTVFLADIRDFTAMNEVYTGKFGDDPPARTTVAVAGITANSLLEVDAIAYI